MGLETCKSERQSGHHPVTFQSPAKTGRTSSAFLKVSSPTLEMQKLSVTSCFICLVIVFRVGPGIVSHFSSFTWCFSNLWQENRRNTCRTTCQPQFGVILIVVFITCWLLCKNTPTFLLCGTHEYIQILQICKPLYRNS